MTDFTLVTCSYNTPEITVAMLKSFAQHHRDYLPVRLLVMENSTDERTAELLEKNSIPFLRFSGQPHSRAIDAALQLIQTTYTAFVDSDVIFLTTIEPLFQEMRESGATIMGERQGDRAGFHLHPRIAPYFMLVNMKNIRKHNIPFHDDARIDVSGSRGFYNMTPTVPDPQKCYYDVGATFYEDIIRAGLRAQPVPELTRYVFHATALSWGARAHAEAQQHVRTVQEVFWQFARESAATDLRGAFRPHDD